MHDKRWIIFNIGDLLLQSEKGTKDWVDVPLLRRLWYAILIIFLLRLLVVGLILPSFFREHLQESASLMRSVRLFLLSIDITLAGLGVVLSLSYYRHILESSKLISLANVMFFYVYEVVMFTYIYRGIYLINNSSFVFPDVPVTLSNNLLTGIESLLLFIDFLVYSLCKSVSATCYKIGENSIVVSLLGVVQILFTLMLTTLLVSSYVNQMIKKGKK